MYRECFLLKTLITLSVLPYPLYPFTLLSCFCYYLTTVRSVSTAVCQSADFDYKNIPKKFCHTCNQRQFYRMKHCETCRKCIHKYDHHCLLLDTCIGEFNHKHYLCFLLTFLASEALAMWTALFRLPDLVTIDDRGIQHFQYLYYLYVLQIFISIATCVMCGCLLIKHLRLVLNNSTSWQENRRPDITYMAAFRPQNQYPFSKGWYNNVMDILRADRRRPKEWELPGSSNTTTSQFQC